MKKTMEIVGKQKSRSASRQYCKTSICELSIAAKSIFHSNIVTKYRNILKTKANFNTTWIILNFQYLQDYR